MLGGWGGSSYANYDDPLAKERDAPPKPLPIQFPSYCPALKTTPLTAQKHAEVKKLLAGIKNPTEVTSRHVEMFNVKYRPNTAVADLFPALPDGLIEEAALSAIVKDEFSIENDPCYRKVCRLPPEKGQTLPRLAQTYLFYKNLEEMSRYWDNSKDNYFEKTEDTTSSPSKSDSRRPSAQQENVKLPTDANGDIHMANSTNDNAHSSSPSTKKLYIGRRNGNASTMPPPIRDSVLDGVLRTATQKFNAVCKPPTQQYTRLQVGELLIPVRQTLVIGRVPTDRNEARKAKTWGPLLVGSARNEVVFRNEGEKIGEGQGEITDLFRELGGLLLLAQQRSREGCIETKPGSGEDSWWAKKERWGGGKGGNMPHEEIETAEEFPKAGEDVVMKDVPNGHTRAKRSFDILVNTSDVGAPSKLTGGTNSPLTPSLNKTHRIPEPASSSPSTAPAASSDPSSAPPRPERPPVSARRVKMMSEAWKLLKPPSSLWDPNVTYKAIGKVDGLDGEWDDVFMISSINTHVSILRMRVSRGYMTWLETGTMSEVQQEKKLGRSGITLPTAKQELRDWAGEVMSREVLYLERSAWWNLFVPDERVEALRSVWTVLSWLSREVGGGKLPWAVK